MNRNPDYAQVRWLAPDGMELVRIDRQGQRVWRVTDDQLQNKGERYYFRDAMALPWERVYVSPLDLNVEHGVIERPFNPMIRIAKRMRLGDEILVCCLSTCRPPVCSRSLPTAAARRPITPCCSTRTDIGCTARTHPRNGASCSNIRISP